MLSTNVLCIKKRKKRSYCIVANKTARENGSTVSIEKNKRTTGGPVMFHVTENTPPDMLAGAMDLTVHLPSKKTVKMSVERTTPMMDLLVQIATANQLNLSDYTLEALSMLPSSEHLDGILPFKPNTPIGALDTQHVRVLLKNRTIPPAKPSALGHQPFESTFRLKVYLPRNQLYVTRVSQSVLLEDIMRKVCEEKNLDPYKYQFRHPGNLDQILDPKLTLSDYKITEIHVVAKGAGNLSQIFSSNDIIALKKEEERKQFHNKTGGGVFNLIFKRGTKQSSGSVSSENRSISPTQSDDSRSVTPPAVQQEIITPPEAMERPKPPQRKRRPAPKPPQLDKPIESSNKTDNGLTICHSRNSSDSSGYHEASVLSENANTSLPRRPKSTIIAEEAQKLSHKYSQSTSNLSKMSNQSKSTSSLGLAVPSRKKKSAPAPPPPQEPPSPVVASQPAEPVSVQDTGNGNDFNNIAPALNPRPKPRQKHSRPLPRPRSTISDQNVTTFAHTSEDINALNEDSNVNILPHILKEIKLEEESKQFKEDLHKELTNTYIKVLEMQKLNANLLFSSKSFNLIPTNQEQLPPISTQASLFREPPENDQHLEFTSESPNEETENRKNKDNENKNTTHGQEEKEKFYHIEKTINKKLSDMETNDPSEKSFNNNEESIGIISAEETDSTQNDLTKIVQSENVSNKAKIVALIPKTKSSYFDSFTRKRGFEIGKSLLEENCCDNNSSSSSSLLSYHTPNYQSSNPNSISSALNKFDFINGFDDDISDIDINLFTGSMSRKTGPSSSILNELHGMHGFDNPSLNKSTSASSFCSIPGFMGNSNMKKWNNIEDVSRGDWLIGDTSDTESVSIQSMNPSQTPLELSEPDGKKEILPIKLQIEEEIIIPPLSDCLVNDLEIDWHYQLPDAPQGFRDPSPEPTPDSILTSPELFETNIPKVATDTLSDQASVVDNDKAQIMSTLSLENLEKRKSLVYNRELATSLKLDDQSDDKNQVPTTFSASLTTFEKTYDEIKQSSQKPVAAKAKSTLPNFKITTYDNPKQKFNIFEDDTIRSNNNRNSLVEIPKSNLQKSNGSAFGKSLENLTFRKNSIHTDENNRYYSKLTKTTHQNVTRSESFHNSEQKWKPFKPVTRSKSQVALNKYRENKSVTMLNEDNLTKSNSLFDVSGLQSLEVMRLIQTKLKTPTNSCETLNESKSYQEQPEIKRQNYETKTRTFRTPSINMGTWSDRPKLPVNVKADPDYKVNSSNNSKLIVKTSNNYLNSHNSVECRNVTIKVNGCEQISAQNTGNVVIKIGENDYLMKKAVPVGGHRPRPHSIAYGPSMTDISRVPIVRSVELKKPFKDLSSNNNNTSITQIYPNGYSSLNLAPKGYYKTSSSSSNNKTIGRVSSAVQNNGFRSQNESNNARNTLNSGQVQSANNRNSWSPSPKDRDFSTNKSVPFSQSNLRRTESTNLKKSEEVAPVSQAPPAPPSMAKLKPVSVLQQPKMMSSDPKEQLLQAIRDFGGKKGLKALNA